MENRKFIGAREKHIAGENACGPLWDAVIACQGDNTASGLSFS